MGFKRRRPGIVLVTVLMMSILIAMFIGAAILIGPRTLGLAGSQDSALTSTAAAESGFQYAVMKIRENPNWRGDGSGLQINTPDLKVVESSGYVWGHMTAPGGSTSMFRIRFNFENGDGNGDHLSNSTGPRTQTPYVSLNNLFNASEAVVPRATNDSASTVPDPTVGDYSVPAHGICLLVEGLTGPGTRTFDPADPEPKGVVQSKILEAIFVVSNLDDLATDAAAMSNGDLVANVSDKKQVKVEAKGGGVPTVRSRGSFKVEWPGGAQGEYHAKGGTVYTKDGSLGAKDASGDLTLEVEDDNDPFYELAWDDLKTADPAGETLAAGTYVWWQDGTLHYYDMDYDTFASHIKANPTDGGDVVFTGGTWTGGAAGLTRPDTLEVSSKKLTVTGDLYVEPTAAGTKDLTIIPREGAPVEPPDADVIEGSSDGNSLAIALANNLDYRTSFFSSQVGDGSDSPTGTMGWQTKGGGAADIWWTGAGELSFSPTDYDNQIDAMTDLFTNFPQFFTTNGFTLGLALEKFGATGAEGDLRLETGDTTTAEDLELNFKPPSGKSATLSSDGNIRIGAKLKGKGASITSVGTLTVVGAGADLEATPNVEEGVNMYAQGDITISTLHDKGNDKYEFKDIKLKGLVYTWGDFHAKLGSDDSNTKSGKFGLEGTLVAFGGDPAQGKPNNTQKGQIHISAEEVKLKFDPAYLLSVMKTLPDNLQFKRTAWTAYR
ncbi:MAG: hypothetical protein WC314_19245 [Vulcanimicrobiota bacterium]